MGIMELERASRQDLTADYNRHFSKLTSQAIGQLLEASGAGFDRQVLDVGTGAGHAAAAATRRGARAVGIDFSSAQVDYARQRHPEIEYVQGNAESLPFPDESQDVVVINFAIHHFLNPDAALASAFRVLRKGGQIGFTTWRPVPETTGFRIVHEAVEAHGICEPGGPWEPHFFRFSDAQECEHSLIGAGFEEPKAKTISLVWQLPSADSLYGAMVKGTAQFAALLETQSPDAKAFIRRDMHNAAQAFEDLEGVHLPMPANLVVARKP